MDVCLIVLDLCDGDLPDSATIDGADSGCHDSLGGGIRSSAVAWYPGGCELDLAPVLAAAPFIAAGKVILAAVLLMFLPRHSVLLLLWPRRSTTNYVKTATAVELRFRDQSVTATTCVKSQ